MLPGLPDYSDAELLTEVLERPRQAFVPYDDLRATRRPGWLQLTTPSFHRGGLNNVELAVLDEHEADAVIDATIAEYDALGIRFRWTVGPDSRPLDLPARLERRGLKPTRVLLLAAAVADLAAEAPANVVVESVDEHNLAAYAGVVAAGWGVEAGPLIAYERAVQAHRARVQDTDYRSFLATIDGEPVGAASGICFPRSLYLMGAVVLPAYRKRGVYQAARRRACAVARARGVRLATCQAMADTSAPILGRMGFVQISEQLSLSR